MPRPSLFLIFMTIALWTSSGIAQSNFSVPFEFCPDQINSVISYELQHTGPVNLVIEHIFTNLHVRTLVQGVQNAGSHQVVWNGTDEQGQPVGTGIYIFKLSGDGWAVEEWGAIDCGSDAAIQSRVIVGGRDVDMGFANIIEDVGDTELAVYSADSATRVMDFSASAYSRYTFFSWGFEDSLGQVLPAGDYVYRMTSPSYSEDIPFSINPFHRGVLSVAVTDGHGNLVTGIHGLGDAPVVKGPLQQLEVNFGRSMSAAEIEYILDGGLTYTGAFGWARPISHTVRPDSMGIIFHDFDLSRPWPDIWGTGSVIGYGMFDPFAGRFQLGFDHQGITRTDRYCQFTGETDINDWVINPGPFFFTPTGTMEPPCNNPIPLGMTAEIRYTIDEDGLVLMAIIDTDGNLVRQLVAEYQQAGSKTIYWDRLDYSGIEVPEGIYHFIWNTQNGDGGAAITSGDIMVSNAVSAVPHVVSDPLLPTLSANHPNPFNPATVISFDLPVDTFARITVLSLDGKRVATLLADRMIAGRHSVTWNGRDKYGRTVPSGAYFYRMEAGASIKTRRMMLLK